MTTNVIIPRIHKYNPFGLTKEESVNRICTDVRFSEIKSLAEIKISMTDIDGQKTVTDIFVKNAIILVLTKRWGNEFNVSEKYNDSYIENGFWKSFWKSVNNHINNSKGEDFETYKKTINSVCRQNGMKINPNLWKDFEELTVNKEWYHWNTQKYVIEKLLEELNPSFDFNGNLIHP